MNKQDMVTAPVAVGAIAWPQVHEFVALIAAEAELVLPVLGAIWLTVQILAKIHNTWLKSKNTKE